jgi:hypothetical protein
VKSAGSHGHRFLTHNVSSVSRPVFGTQGQFSLTENVPSRYARTLESVANTAVASRNVDSGASVNAA